MKAKEKGKKNGKLKYVGVVVVLAFLAGVYLASATTAISIGPDEIRVGNTVIGESIYTDSNVDVNGDLRVRGDLTVDGSAEGGGLPSGVIVMWSGSVANIPSGWALCDGSRGTPDLRGKFILCVDGSYSVGNTGGASTHTHGAGSYASPTGTISGSTTYSYGKDNGEAGRGRLAIKYGQDATWETTSYYLNADILVSGDPLTGTSGSASSLPPYYALAYIMKL